MARLRSLLLDAVSDDDLRAVVRKLVEQARGGDTAAAKLLLAYVVGRPAGVVDPDGLDLQEWLQCQKWPDTLNDPLLNFGGLRKVNFAEGVRMAQRLSERGQECSPRPLFPEEDTPAADPGPQSDLPGPSPASPPPDAT